MSVPPVGATIIGPEQALEYAIAVRTLMSEVGMAKFARPHPLRDLLDALTGPSDAWCNENIPGFAKEDTNGASAQG